MLFSCATLALLPLFGSPAEETRGGVEWFPGSYAEALKEAEDRETLVLVEFWANWCGWCKKHEAENLVDPAVLKELATFVCYGADLSVDEESNIADKEAEGLMNRFAIRRFPGVVLVRPDGRPEDVISGYLPKDRFLAELARIKAGKNTATDFERRIEATPDDLELRFRYAEKLAAMGDFVGYQAELDHIIQADPEGVSLPRRRLALGILREELWGCLRDPDQEPDPAKLVSFLEDEPYPENLCNGWLLMAAVQHELGNGEESRAAYRTAWEHVSEDQIASIGNGIAWGFWQQEGDLTTDEKRWALKLSLEATEDFEAKNNDPTALAQYVDTLACCYYMNGKRAKALELMRRCMELDPETQEYRERYERFRERG